jgi:L-fuculose-phosphate aldolase
MKWTETELRERVIACARDMNAVGINQGKSGNVSARWADGFLVTPSGVPYASLQPADLAFVDGSGRAEGRLPPSSEWRFHFDIYKQRAAANAIVHAHPPCATALACQGRGIPAFHYMVAAAGGPDIPCAAYATFGTAELSAHVVAALQGRRACLMAQHGLVATGPDLSRALALAVEVETLARMYLQALAVGEPALLEDAEMARVLEKFESYGPASERS